MTFFKKVLYLKVVSTRITFSFLSLHSMYDYTNTSEVLSSLEQEAVHSSNEDELSSLRGIRGIPAAGNDNFESTTSHITISSPGSFFGGGMFGELEMLLFFFGTTTLIMIAIGVVLKVFYTIVFGKLFEKAKQAWRWALIPVINSYMFAKLLGRKSRFWIPLMPFVCFVGSRFVEDSTLSNGLSRC